MLLVVVVGRCSLTLFLFFENQIYLYYSNNKKNIKFSHLGGYNGIGRR